MYWNLNKTTLSILLGATWSAVINRTSRAGELRSAPSGPDDWHRGYGLESPSPGGARSQGKGRKVNTGLRGLVPCTGFPLNCRTPPLLGANEHTTLYSTYVHGHASCAPARLRSQSPFLRPSGRALGSSRSLARLPGVTMVSSIFICLRFCPRPALRT